MSEMSDTLADTLSALEKGATAGPWEARPFEANFPLADWFLTDGAANLSDDMSRANAALIVAIRNNLPAILSALRRVEKLEAALREIRDLCSEEGGFSDSEYVQGREQGQEDAAQIARQALSGGGDA